MIERLFYKKDLFWGFCVKKDHNGSKMTIFKFKEKLIRGISLIFCMKLEQHA